MRDLIRAAANAHDTLTLGITLAQLGIEAETDTRWVDLYEVGILDLADGHWTLVTEEEVRPIDVDEIVERIMEVAP